MTHSLSLSVTSDADVGVQEALHDVATAAEMEGYRVDRQFWRGIPGICAVHIERDGPAVPLPPRVELALVRLIARSAGVDE